MFFARKYIINVLEIDKPFLYITKSCTSDKNIYELLRVQCFKNVVDDFILDLTLVLVQPSSFSFVYHILLKIVCVF